MVSDTPMGLLCSLSVIEKQLGGDHHGLSNAEPQWLFPDILGLKKLKIFDLLLDITIRLEHHAPVHQIEDQRKLMLPS